MKTKSIEQPYEFYEESRQYPRVKIRLPINLFINNGQCVAASIYDISPDGLQIRCNRDIAAALNPSGKKINTDDNVMVITEFVLPINDEQKTVKVACKIYYIVVIAGNSEEDVAFGLQFKTFEGNSIKNIGRHILNELEPAT